MAGLKRTDNKGRILKDGESQRKDGSYRYRYTDADGVRRDVYSKRLVSTDRLPPGCKDDLTATLSLLIVSTELLTAFVPPTSKMKRCWPIKRGEILY